MSPAHTSSSPAPDATVVPTGRRGAMTGLPCSVLLIVIGAAGVSGGVVVATGNQKGESGVAGFAGLAFMVALGVLGVFLFVGHWANRSNRILVDGTGLWIDSGKLQHVIPWQSLAGVALHWSRFGRSQKVYSLEMFPNGPVDRDDPALWTLVRDEEPPQPGLSRLRYRLPFPSAQQQQVVTAVHSQVPQLWLGESERPTGHIGRPDVRGHRERTRGRTP
ncbi:hypothetical protein [Streptomyces fulvoviolaceus]|uniref:hypothetical protein n=1 Tax=Streptomyces fulvoviolaceus TaxID=285535 RepID=UPI0004CB8653|nr:hypothetical protein [Streptomyces fulvoviolaceus]